MNRRNFLHSILGVAAATALPSEVWPFRKIFLPANLALPRWIGVDYGFDKSKVFVVHPAQAAVLSDLGMYPDVYYAGNLRRLSYLELSRSNYPGKLSVPSLIGGNRV